jgi:hypothetical protein
MCLIPQCVDGRRFLRKLPTGISLPIALALALLSTNFNLTLLHGDSFLDGESDGVCVLVKLHSPGISQRGPDHGLVEVNKTES